MRNQTFSNINIKLRSMVKVQPLIPKAVRYNSCILSGRGGRGVVVKNRNCLTRGVLFTYVFLIFKGIR